MLEASNNLSGSTTPSAHVCSLHACKGFSLIELIAVLAVAAILINLAAPSFADAMANAKLAVRTNLLTQSIHFGRSEAVKRASSVSICARSTDTQCSTDNDWSEGWLVYTDSSSDGSLGQLDATDTVLKAVAFEASGIDLTASAVIGTNAKGAVKNIRFNSRGFANWTAGTFAICSEDNADKTKSVIVLGAGAVRSTGGSATTAAKDAFNMDINC